MTGLRDLARAKLRQLEAGQGAGQDAGQGVSRPTDLAPPLRDTSTPQKTAENGEVSRCPVPIGAGQRDSAPKTGTVGKTVGGTPAPLDDRIAAARLREWHAHLSRIDELTSPPGWTLNDWLRLVDAATWVYENYASQAVRDGWSALDLFGYLPAMPGCGGLADRLKDTRNLKLADGLACWSSFGVKQQFCRGGSLDLVGSGLVLLWETK